MVTNQHAALEQRFPHVDLFFDPSDFEAFRQFVPELSDFEDDLATLPHYYVDQTASSTVSAPISRLSTAVTFSVRTASCRIGAVARHPER